jgi:hypothetical protein
MAVPASVQTQIDALNTNVNTLLNNRGRLIAWFDDGLGASVWSLLSTGNKTAANTAMVNEMQAAVTALQNVVNALDALA